MQERNPFDRLDRHALVMAVWLPLGLVALTLFHYGFSGGGTWWIAGGFGAVLAGFLAHVIINAVLGTDFGPREVALGLAGFAACVVALLLALLLVPGFGAAFLLPVALGLIAVAGVVLGYLLIAHGPRGAFALFDIIRDNNPRAGSRLPHRGGRR